MDQKLHFQISQCLVRNLSREKKEPQLDSQSAATASRLNEAP